jgi:hypothetical protein
VQGFFRTIKKDSSGFGIGKPGFKDKAIEAEFCQSVAGFIKLFDEFLYHKIRVSKRELKQLLAEYLDDMDFAQLSDAPIPSYLGGFTVWLAISPMKLRKFTRDSVIEQFCGPSDSNSSLSWPEIETIIEGSYFDYSMGCYIARSEARQDTFSITSDGYMGLGLQGMMTGDEICCVPGCGYPLAIRRAPKTDEHMDGEEYKLLGACYVYGMMNGEIAGDPKSKEKMVFMAGIAWAICFLRSTRKSSLARELSDHNLVFPRPIVDYAT